MTLQAVKFTKCNASILVEAQHTVKWNNFSGCSLSAVAQPNPAPLSMINRHRQLSTTPQKRAHVTNSIRLPAGYLWASVQPRQVESRSVLNTALEKRFLFWLILCLRVQDF